MSTGYTYIIKDGADFKTFALRCAKALDFLSFMRNMPNDAPIPPKKPKSESYKKQLAEAKEELAKFQNMTLAQASEAANHDYLVNLKYYSEMSAERAELKQKYTDMLNKVHAWQPPSKMHVGLKKFMIEQIESSISFDCTPTSIPQKLSSMEWLQTHIERAERSVEFYAEKDKMAEEGDANYETWVRQLLESLEANK